MPRNPDPDGKGPGIARFRGLFAARFSLLGGRFRGLLRGRFRAGGNPLLILFAHPVELFHQLSCAAFVLRQVQHQADQAEVRLVEAFDDQGRLVGVLLKPLMQRIEVVDGIDRRAAISASSGLQDVL